MYTVDTPLELVLLYIDTMAGDEVVEQILSEHEVSVT